MTTGQRIILGVLAAILSVLIFHQGMLLLLRETGMLPATVRVWNLRANPWGIPVIVNACLWGSLYGAAFGWLAPRFRVSMPTAGILTGIVATLVGFFVVATLKGTPIAGGWHAMAWIRSLLIHVSFGLGIGLIYPLLASKLFRPPLPRR
jgi:hypothetical protein